MAAQRKSIALPKSQRVPIAGARRIGVADPHQRIEVSLVLRRRSKPAEFPEIEEIGARLPAARFHLTREEFASTHGARAEDLAAIRNFAAENGLQVVSEIISRRTVVLGGTVEAFSRAFEVELSRYEHPMGSYRGRTGPLRIPQELSGVIEGVFGLDDRPQARPHFRRLQDDAAKARQRAAQVTYTPLQVARAYDFPTGMDGTGQSIAILELGGGYRAADLNAFFTNLQIPIPKVTAVSVDGAANSPTGDPSGPDGEVALDIEIAGAVAPRAQIGVYFAPNTDRGFLDALTTAIHDTNLRPSVISISWGGPENTWTQQAMEAFDNACQDASAMGITILAASGDNGATDGDPEEKLTVDFPASAPHVTGCGGTKLVASGNKITDEEAWNELKRGEGATGGGVSEVFSLPAWQQSAGVPVAPNGSQGRGVPDVAGDADPVTGYHVLVDGAPSIIGGTSAVAPLWAGLVALLNQALQHAIGYFNPLLYTPNVEAALNDVSKGNNGGYSARKGWDACTGLGTPDGSRLLTALGWQPAGQARGAGAAA